MMLSQLRRRHHRLIYRDFKVKTDGKNLRVGFNFLLEPDIVFSPEISIPFYPLRSDPAAAGSDLFGSQVNNLAFHLGLIESLSYWKAACPAELVVEAGYLSPDQIAWWRHLFIHGLGEFFFRNQIDFTAPNFLTIQSNKQRSNLCGQQRLDLYDSGGDLILVGGGKDSIVTMEALKQSSQAKNVMLLNPGPNSLAAARLAGYQNPIIITRIIDPKLLQLNKQGYLNGHTPFSAYLAFLGVFVAYLHGYKNVISSNELSAGEAGLIYKSMEINHQYSKSFAFEKLFRRYCVKYLTSDIQYFSFLRPLYEIQIARLFSNLAISEIATPPAVSGKQRSPRNDGRSGSKYDAVFTSCNVGRGKFWCGRCPKCAFSYLSLFPFMSDARLKSIFGRDLFEAPEIQRHILDLVGLGEHKPFDCVGTKDESILAVALAIEKNKKQKTKNPGLAEAKPRAGKKQQEFLMSLETSLRNFISGDKFRQLHQRIMDNWNDQNFLPPEYSQALKIILRT
jgi:hypothetical protein